MTRFSHWNNRCLLPRLSRLQRRYRRIVEVHPREERLEVGVGHEGGAVALGKCCPRRYERADQNDTQCPLLETAG